MILGLIPSRLSSRRLYQKPLININGLPLIIHTLLRARMSKKLDKVIVCTDSSKIYDLVKKYNGEAIITSKKHKNGTERIAEVAKKFKCKLIVDIQGDEPLINPKDIDKVIKFHKNNKRFDIVVPYIKAKNINNKNTVKIVNNNRNRILYMSRSKIPFSFKKKIKFLNKHLSIISFKPKALQNFANKKMGNLESIEGIELLRGIENEMILGTFPLSGRSMAVDIKSDLNEVKKIMINDPVRKLYK